jgi:tetratricopeptide (TPR) repeat protein
MLAFWLDDRFTHSRGRIRRLQEEIQRSFLVLPFPITQRERNHRKDHAERFYAGFTDGFPLLQVGLDLDSPRFTWAAIEPGEPRPLVDWAIQRIEESAKEFVHMPVSGNSRQGKSVFLARLAATLASRRRKFHVIWCRGLGAPFIDEDARDSYLRAPLLLEYARQLRPWHHNLPLLGKALEKARPHRRLVVFLDGFLHEDLPAGDAELEDEAKRVYRMLEELISSDIVLVTASIHNPLTFPTALPTLKLALREPDACALLRKLECEMNLPSNLTSGFVAGPHGQRLYRQHMPAFLESLFAHLGRMGHPTAYLASYEHMFDSLSSELQVLFLRVAACQMLDLPMPESAIYGASYELLSRIRSGLNELLTREVAEERKPRITGYSLGAPFFSHRILRDHLCIGSDKLETIYLDIVRAVLASPQGLRRDQEFLRGVLYRLARPRETSLLTSQESSSIAKTLLLACLDPVDEFLSRCTQVDVLVPWALTFRVLDQPELSRRYLLHAHEEFACNPLAVPTSTRIVLAMGLAEQERVERTLALSLFAELLQQAIDEQDPPVVLNRLAHKYADVLQRAGDVSGAMAVLTDVAEHAPPDAIMLIKRGELLEAAGRFEEARTAFKAAIASGERAPWPNNLTRMTSAHRYAVFLADNFNAIPTAAREDAEEWFRKAAEAAGLIGEHREVVLSAWAQARQRRGDLKGAAQLYAESMEYCEGQGITHAHSFNGYANFLVHHGRAFPKTPYSAWLSDAESYLHRVLESPHTDGDSRRIANHILGMLVGLGGVPDSSHVRQRYVSHDGRVRPDLQEGIELLRAAFESPEEVRNDDSRKVWQDVLTHAAIATVYRDWMESHNPPVAEMKELIAKVSFHFQRAFVGLPRPGLDSLRVFRHALEKECDYAFFLWKHARDYDAAVRRYEHAIAAFEQKDDRWPEAKDLYWYYSVFLWETLRNQNLDKIAELQAKALALEVASGERGPSKIRRALGRTLHSLFLEEFGRGDLSRGMLHLEEAIAIFDRHLESDPNDGRYAKELSHFLFGRRIPTEARAPSRLAAIATVLLRTWTASPANALCCDGLLDLGDELVQNGSEDFHRLQGEILQFGRQSDLGRETLQQSLLLRARKGGRRGLSQELLQLLRPPT